MKPTDILTHEHQVILLVLDAAEREGHLVEREGEVRTKRIEQMLDFFSNFADRCHHAKEEDLLFPRMEARGIPSEGGLIGALLAEHRQGRQFISTVRGALPQAAAEDARARRTVSAALLGYVELLRAHIDKEDHDLYPMADRVFDAHDQGVLEQSFERVEAEELEAGVHERYHALAHQLAEHE